MLSSQEHSKVGSLQGMLHKVAFSRVSPYLVGGCREAVFSPIAEQLGPFHLPPMPLQGRAIGSMTVLLQARVGFSATGYVTTVWDSLGCFVGGPF